MKQKIFFLLAVILFTAVSVAADPPGNETPMIKTTTKCYGMSLLAGQSGIFSFDLKSPEKTTMLYQLENDEIASGGTYANGKYYTMVLSSDQKPKGLYTFNLKTGERKLLLGMSDAFSFFLDLTYDYTTSTLYALWQNYPNTTFIKVNTETGQPTFIKDISNVLLYSLAAAPDGTLYAMNSGGIMYSLDKTNGALTQLFQLTDMTTKNFQSMDFDFNSGRLYWACQKYKYGTGTNMLYEIDLDKKTAIEIGKFPYLTGGLHTAFTEAVPESPQTIMDLKIELNGSFQPVLSWTNPATTLANNSLSNLSSAEVYRNDTLVNKVTGIVPGAASVWTDTSAPNKVNKYKIITFTTDNYESIPVWKSIFAGKDFPGAPTDVVVTKLNQTSASVVWKAPVSGLNKSWFDKESLVYKIVRKPGNTVVADNVRETTFTDLDVTAYANYSYQVISVNSNGEGGSTLSTAVSLGESIRLPFLSPLDTQENFDLWTTFSRDDLPEAWYLGKMTGSKNGAESYTKTATVANNWLISPPLYLEKDKVYELSFKANTSYYNNEGLRITLGKEQNPEAQSVQVGDLKIKEYYGKKFALIFPDLEADGVYYLGLQHYTTPGDGMVLHINDLELKEQDKGEVSGVVTDGTAPVAGVTVTLTGHEVSVAKTDAEGKYKFTDVVAGKYNLKAVLLGYEEKENEISVTPLNKTVADIVLPALPQYRVSGKITDMAGNPLQGADITVSGYNKYTAKTGADGFYTFERIYGNNSYSISVRKNNFEPVSNPLPVGGDMENETIKLVYKNLPPLSVKATESAAPAGTIALEWERPVDLNAFQYDNNQPGGPLGYDVGTEYHVFGTIYRVPTVVHSVKWFTLPDDKKKPYVHVYIIDLDENGRPTGKLLFSQKNVPTQDYVWTTFQLPRQINAPRGFMVALSGEGHIMIAKDNNPETVEKQTQCYSTFYESPSSYTYFDDVKWSGALMIRAEGEVMESNASPLRVTYDLWRLLEKDQATPEKWTSLKVGITGQTATDETLAALPRDTYKYAVKANYPVGNLTSGATFSSPVYHKQYTDVTVNVTANSIPEDANGAIVTLKDNQGNDYQASVTGQKAVFSKIWKGTYTLNITQRGFEKLEKTLDAATQDSYDFSYTISQIIAPVNNIDIMTTDKPDEWQLLWSLFDNIEDGFDDESYQDFEMNPAGSVGWQYIDNDKCLTYGFANTAFPNNRERMAAIIFNSTTTEPPLGIHTAFSGDRALAFFAARETEDEDENIIFHDSDDYLISPKLDYHKDFTFSFYARSYNDENGLERIRAGYSKTDAALESFIFPDPEYTDVPTEYTLYSYSIPKDAKYVTLNSHSRNSFLLLVDDVFIGTNQKTSTGYKGGGGSFKNYKIFVDNKLLTDTKENRYLLTGLTPGKHTASVTKVYNSKESEPLAIDFTVNGGESISSAGNDGIIVYLAPGNQLVIRGDYRSVQLFDSTGTPVLYSDSQSPQFNLNGLSKGVYMVHITAPDQQRTVHKVVLK